MVCVIISAALAFSSMASASKLSDQTGVDLPLGERSLFSDRAIAERIQPSGSVCVDGDECEAHIDGAPAVGDDVAAAGPRSGDAVYQAACLACHMTGAAGAPKLGDAGAWSERIAQGMDVLVEHAIVGYKAMPPKGGCGSCSDEEIQLAVEYIVENSQ